MTAAAIVLPLALFGTVAAIDRRMTLAATERNLRSTLDTLHGHAENRLEFQALAVGATVRLLRRAEEAGADVATLHDDLRALRQYSGDTLGLVVFDAGGRPVVESDRPDPSPSIDVSGREYFRHHRQHAGHDPYLARPVRSQRDGSTVSFMTARRVAPDGAFAGVVAAGIRQATFVDHWNRATPDASSLVNLVRNDGVILARRPAVDLAEQPTLSPDAPLAIAIRSGAERTVVGGSSPIDGVERLFAFRRLDGFNAVIAHGVSRDAALAPWRRRLALYGALAVAAVGALLWLSVLLRRRDGELLALNADLEGRVAERTAELQASEERLRLLAREVDHRAKNALAVVQATLRLTPKTDPQSYSRAVEGRISALARVQTLLAADRWRGASLEALLRAELLAFASGESGSEEPRVKLDGPPVLIPATSAQPVAMAVHELATNAVKHGALSQPGGRAVVSWRLKADDAGRGTVLSLRWTETGGPRLTGVPERRGFGSRVLTSVVSGQLGGSLDLRWEATGLVADIEVPLARFASLAAAPDVAA